MNRKAEDLKEYPIMNEDKEPNNIKAGLTFVVAIICLLLANHYVIDKLGVGDWFGWLMTGLSVLFFWITLKEQNLKWKDIISLGNSEKEKHNIKSSIWEELEIMAFLGVGGWSLYLGFKYYEYQIFDWKLAIIGYVLLGAGWLIFRKVNHRKVEEGN